MIFEAQCWGKPIQVQRDLAKSTQKGQAQDRFVLSLVFYRCFGITTFTPPLQT